jgi:hypothetical protein
MRDMKNKRVVKGNFTTVPTGADLLSTYETNAVTEKFRPGEGDLPLSSYDSVVASREFMMENKK